MTNKTLTIGGVKFAVVEKNGSTVITEVRERETLSVFRGTSDECDIWLNGVQSAYTPWSNGAYA